MGECAERCELCGAPAAVHCAADAAFLCAGCDARVHGANFLASRHSRSRLVVACAPGSEAATAAEEEDEGYASTASSCVSTAAESASTTGRRGRRSAGSPRQARGAEVVIEGWAKRMGLPAHEARRRAAATGRTLRACGPDVAAARVPLRVNMAAALWREVASGSGAGAARGCDALRRLEECANVPARLVLTVAASMMARERARRRAAADAMEGWDECSYVGPKSNPARS